MAPGTVGNERLGSSVPVDEMFTAASVPRCRGQDDHVFAMRTLKCAGATAMCSRIPAVRRPYPSFLFLRSVQLELRNDAWTAEGLVSDLEHVHILQWEWSMAGDVLALPEPVVIAGVVERFRHPGEVAVTVVRVVAEV